MAYSNYLLFNNVFLGQIAASESDLSAARYLVHESARDWYREASFETPEQIVNQWLRPLLSQQTLELVPAGFDDLAWLVVAPWDRATPLGLCYVAPAGTDLNGYSADGTLPKGQHWMVRAVDAATRVAPDPVHWVILTNGVQWRLLDAAGLRRYEAHLEIDLGDLLQGEDDPLAAYLFYRLFRLEDAFGRDEASERSGLDAFLELSEAATKETEDYLKVAVTDDLGTPGGGDGIMAQFCMGIVNALDPTGTRGFTEGERGAIYRDATYLLYRLLFILYAEARDLLPMGRADYRRVSLTHLIEEAVAYRQLDHKSSVKATVLWDQLNTLFNSIHYSDEYLGIPPYNGGLFDNDDKPFLRDYAIDNRFLAEALYQLTFLRDRDGKHPPERIDYRDLSVRHLGSLYEGMIEYQLFVAEETLLARLEKKGKSSRVQYLPAAGTTRKPNDEEIALGKVYFAQSSRERKATGTHYTPEPLVERLVQQTLGRLLSERWAPFEVELQKWLEEIADTPDVDDRRRLQDYFDSRLDHFVREQILSLRICDPAMGSGHFHVHIAHVLTNFILHALAYGPWSSPSVNLDPNYWRRQVVEHCLYGVDINEMAVELAKLSLWLATMQVGRPLSFLDHHLKQGNSLLGVSLAEIIEVLENNDLNKQTRVTKLAEERGQYTFSVVPTVVQNIEQANKKLEDLLETAVRSVNDIAEQEAHYFMAQEILKPYRLVGDLLVAQKMGLGARSKDLRAIAKALVEDALEYLDATQLGILEHALLLTAAQPKTHWELDFSRIFAGVNSIDGKKKGYDIIIGNPPYLGGSKISSELGPEFLRYIKASFSHSQKNTDLCAYFFRVSFDTLANSSSYIGMVATNSIGEGDSRETGLEVIVRRKGAIVFADRFVRWPGDATVEVNLVVIAKAPQVNHSLGAARLILDGKFVDYISSYLDDLSDEPIYRLVQNRGLCFLGDNVAGIGFVVPESHATNLIVSNPRYSRCLAPFINGSDINDSPSSHTDRYAICFHDWPLAEAEKYPELLRIVREQVKPTRDKANRAAHRNKWWLYGDYRKGLREACSNLSKVLIRSRVSELHGLVFAPSTHTFSDATVVFAYDDYYHFALIQSCTHEIWLRRNASTLRTDIRYTPTDCFQTFPFPPNVSAEAQLRAESTGADYYAHRLQTMLARQEGLTKVYKHFHNPKCTDEDIVAMRRLHAEMDWAILACYGWDDIDLDHGFYPNDRGKTRFMPVRAAQRDLFTRLIVLNQSIAAAEAAQGLVVETSGDEEALEEDTA